MIKLSKRKIKNDWLDLGDKQRVKIDYPTLEQDVKLQDIILSTTDENVKMMQYARYYIKYTVKDWEGLGEPCKVIKDELDESQWLELTSDIEQTMTLSNMIYEELHFSETDKKK